MDEAEAAPAEILADCASDDDLQRYIMKHATLVQRLACRMVRGRDHAEERIRELYANLADLAVENLQDSGTFFGRKLH